MAAIALGCFLVANFVVAVVCAIAKGVKQGGIALGLFLVALPGLGLLIYFVPVLLRRFQKGAGVDREAVLTHAFEIERQPEHPDMEEALNVVPVEDAMAVSGNAEKRALLLDQLKRDLQENYKVLLVAGQDEDSESAHYVAAAKMEIYRLQQARWLECRRDLEENPDDPECFHRACDVLEEMLESGVLSEREEGAYRKRLCALIEERIVADETMISQHEYEEYLDALVELGECRQAERLWASHADRMRSERSYQTMLRMFYQEGNLQRFEEVLDDLRQNRQVRLSPQGLEQLRYWLGRVQPTGTV